MRSWRPSIRTRPIARRSARLCSRPRAAQSTSTSGRQPPRGGRKAILGLDGVFLVHVHQGIARAPDLSPYPKKEGEPDLDALHTVSAWVLAPLSPWGEGLGVRSIRLPP